MCVLYFGTTCNNALCLGPVDHSGRSYVRVCLVIYPKTPDTQQYRNSWVGRYACYDNNYFQKKKKHILGKKNYHYTAGDHHHTRCVNAYGMCVSVCLKKKKHRYVRIYICIYIFIVSKRLFLNTDWFFFFFFLPRRITIYIFQSIIIHRIREMVKTLL